MSGGGSVGAERSTHCISFFSPRPSVTTHDPPSATGCPSYAGARIAAIQLLRRSLVPGARQFEACSPWATSEAFQYLFSDQAVVLALAQQPHANITRASGSLPQRLPNITSTALVGRTVCLSSAQGLLRLWLQLRSAANVGCAHPIQSTRRPSYIIAFL